MDKVWIKLKAPRGVVKEVEAGLGVTDWGLAASHVIAVEGDEPGRQYFYDGEAVKLDADQALTLARLVIGASLPNTVRKENILEAVRRAQQILRASKDDLQAARPAPSQPIRLKDVHAEAIRARANVPKAILVPIEKATRTASLSKGKR